MDRKAVEALIKKAQDRRQFKVQGPLPSRVSIVLANADLANADLSGMDLSGCNLHKAILKGANLTDAKFNRANLSGAVFDGAELKGATFKEANLSTASWKGCKNIPMETVTDFEVRLGVRQSVIDKAADKVKAAADWDAIPIEKKYDCRTVVLANGKYVINRKKLDTTNLKGLVL